MRAFNSGLKDFFKSKFFIILLSVAIFLTVIPATLTAMGRTDLLRSAFNFIATPFKNLAKFCGDSLQGFAEYFTEFDRLKAENEALSQQLEEEKKKNDGAEIAKAENEWLRNFVLFVNQNPQLKLSDALTIGRDDGDFITNFTLNKGTLDGISVNMAVMNEKGVIGYISEAGLSYSKVTTIITDNARVGAICLRSGAYGTLEGNLSFAENGLCKMVIPSENADIKEGDSVVTSGKGQVYPFGINIGTVINVKKDPLSRNVLAYIKPSVDFKDISRVLVVVDRGTAETSQDESETDSAKAVDTDQISGGLNFANRKNDIDGVKYMDAQQISGDLNGTIDRGMNAFNCASGMNCERHKIGSNALNCESGINGAKIVDTMLANGKISLENCQNNEKSKAFSCIDLSPDRLANIDFHFGQSANVDFRSKPLANIDLHPEHPASVDFLLKQTTNVDFRSEQLANIDLHPEHPASVDFLLKQTANVDFRSKPLANIDLHPEHPASVDFLLKQTTNVDFRSEQLANIDLHPVQTAEIDLKTADFAHIDNVSRENKFVNNPISDRYIAKTSALSLAFSHCAVKNFGADLERGAIYG